LSGGWRKRQIQAAQVIYNNAHDAANYGTKFYLLPRNSPEYGHI
jgi:hypothetical protein